MKAMFLVAALGLGFVSSGEAGVAAKASTVIVAEDAVWSYYSTPGRPKKNWRVGAGQRGWKSGPLPIGYEMGGLRTIFTSESEPSKKFPVAYFRRAFQLPPVHQLSELRFLMECDDGCIAFLNGAEIGRLRVPLNSPPIYGAEYHDRRIATITIPVGDLRKGQNILAVEVRQANATSSDMKFEASLTAR